jgi:hypothetical protein
MGRCHTFAVKSADAVISAESSLAQLILWTMPAWLPSTQHSLPVRAWYNTTCSQQTTAGLSAVLEGD